MNLYNITSLSLNDYILNINDNISSLIWDYNKLTKIKEENYIFSNHIRDINKNIILDSITVEILNHTKDYKIIRNNDIENNIKIILIEDFLLKLKTKIYLDDINLCCDIESLNINTKTDILELNKNIFFCNHYIDVWGHTELYFYQQIYFYLKIKDFIPDLLLVISYNSIGTNFLLELLNIKNYILINNTQKIINKGITYCVGVTRLNMTNEIINDFYYNTISIEALKKQPIIENFYPKKILFLRKSDNIRTPRYLSNRQEIVELCNKYGYVDIDQTKLNNFEIIKLMNNATHIIQESGGSLVHLLWTHKIKSIVLVYSYLYGDTCGNISNECDKYLSYVSNNYFTDILKNKESIVVYNDIEFIKSNIAPSNTNYNFINISKLIEAIKENE